MPLININGEIGGNSTGLHNVSGSISGLHTVSGSISSRESVRGELTVPRPGGGVPYVLPPATTETLGGIIVGEDLLITEAGILSIDKATAVSEDNTKPITAAAVYTEIGNIDVLLQSI